jgi:hypothetical protein
MGVETGAQGQSERRKLLEERVEQLNKYLADGKVEEALTLFSKRQRERIEDDINFKEKTLRELKIFNALKSKFAVKDILIEKSRATVTIVVGGEIVLFGKVEKLGDFPSYQIWVYEENNWFFDDELKKTPTK